MDYNRVKDENERKSLREMVREAAVDRAFLEDLPDIDADPDRVYTMDDIRALPEEIRAELVNGKIFIMQAPKTTHQRIVGRLYLEITNYIHERGGDCEAFLSPFGVYLKNDDSTYLLPDLTVICDRDKLDEDGCHGAPDWVIEVISPSTSKRDYGKKLFLYRDAGVREYWVIDPARRIIMVYLFGQEEEAAIWRFEDEVPCSIYPDLTIRLADFL